MWNKPQKVLSTYAAAYNFALDRLAARDHSSLELRDKLAARGCPEELQDKVLAALQDHHFINDERCAGAIVEAWRRKKYYGRQYLRLMMTKRQIPAAIISEKLAEVPEEEEKERALDLALQQIPKLRRKYGADIRKGMAALSRMLAARGFNGSAVSGALRAYEGSDFFEE